MLDQSFSVSNLLKLLRVKDIIQYKLGRDKSEYEEKLKPISKKIQRKSYRLGNFREICTGGKNNKIIYIPENIEDNFCVRKINDNLKRLYRVKQANRSVIIKQLITLLKEPIPMSIIRLDIKSYYESINRKTILDKINKDSLLSFRSKDILNRLFRKKQFRSLNGLPRGLGISATLSEIYMRNFDKQVKAIDGVYYYARFVDDIVVLTYKVPDKVKLNIEKILEGLCLELSSGKGKINVRTIDCGLRDTCRCKFKKKCSADDGKLISLQYLGYRFTTPKVPFGRSGSRILGVDLALSTEKKIKSRIIYALLDYSNDQDYKLLKHRLEFLTGNYPITINNKKSTLRGGIRYNYQFLDADSKSLWRLTKFLQKSVTAKKGTFGIKINSSLTMAQKKELLKLSFIAGFQKPVFHNFTLKRLSEIKDCWEKYEQN